MQRCTSNTPSPTSAPGTRRSRASPMPASTPASGGSASCGRSTTRPTWSWTSTSTPSRRRRSSSASSARTSGHPRRAPPLSPGSRRPGSSKPRRFRSQPGHCTIGGHLGGAVTRRSRLDILGARPASLRLLSVVVSHTDRCGSERAGKACAGPRYAQPSGKGFAGHILAPADHGPRCGRRAAHRS